MASLTSFLIFAALLGGIGAFNQQSVGARGRIMCGNRPDNATIKLWNKNFGSDDQLAAVKTDGQGNFQLNGGIGALFSMDVHLKIYTDCNRWLPCQRKIDFKIPSNYVTRTSNVQTWYDMGTLNVEAKFKDEDTKCF